ncbi:hypothetical protein CHRY9293_00182 [Chryseobacterium potabilaquae]|uniref:Uncharacterized protein n=1 Tax=Chryseobacterium potabilaquae TaxID=2675057 RepID=A0A6N4X663_9FLAO|nr:hypothetical protein CHRY9293_00182 [Chryseobacterium potabilaquae]
MIPPVSYLKSNCYTLIISIICDSFYNAKINIEYKLIINLIINKS